MERELFIGCVLPISDLSQINNGGANEAKVIGTIPEQANQVLTEKNIPRQLSVPLSLNSFVTNCKQCEDVECQL